MTARGPAASSARTTGAPYPPVPPLAVPRLVVLRHGRTEWNATGRFQGQLDPPLDDEGRRQALRTAAHVAGRLDPASTVVVSSDLVRATATAVPVAELLGVPLRVDPRLREHGLGLWEGLTRAEVAERYPEQYAAWTSSRPVPERGGEDPADVAERALAALCELQAAVAVVVTHGGTGMRLIEALLGLHPDQRRLLGPLGNCCWSELDAREGRWRLARHNTPAPSAPGTPDTAAGVAPAEVRAPAQDADVLT